MIAIFGSLLLISFCGAMNDMPLPEHAAISKTNEHKWLRTDESSTLLYHSKGLMVMFKNLGINEGDCDENNNEDESAEATDAPIMTTEETPEERRKKRDTEDNDCTERHSRITDPVSWYIDTIDELDENGTVLMQHNIGNDKSDLEFTVDASSPVVDIPGTEVEALSGSMSLVHASGFTIRITAYIVKENGTIDSRQVYTGIVKFNTVIENYPFTNDENQLVINLKIEARCKAVQKERPADATGSLQFDICKSGHMFLPNMVSLHLTF